jgi:hypothetical protein
MQIFRREMASCDVAQRQEAGFWLLTVAIGNQFEAKA